MEGSLSTSSAGMRTDSSWTVPAYSFSVHWSWYCAAVWAAVSSACGCACIWKGGRLATKAQEVVLPLPTTAATAVGSTALSYCGRRASWRKLGSWWQCYTFLKGRLGLSISNNSIYNEETAVFRLTTPNPTQKESSGCHYPPIFPLLFIYYLWAVSIVSDYHWHRHAVQTDN
jgi:hypothetical protein